MALRICTPSTGANSTATTHDTSIATGTDIEQGPGQRSRHEGDTSRLETTKPENVARVFTTYRLPGVMNKVTVGGGGTVRASAGCAYPERQG